MTRVRRTSMPIAIAATSDSRTVRKARPSRERETTTVKPIASRQKNSTKG